MKDDRTRAVLLIFEIFIPGPQIAYLGSGAKDCETKTRCRQEVAWKKKSLDVGVRRATFWSHFSNFNYSFLC